VGLECGVHTPSVMWIGEDVGVGEGPTHEIPINSWERVRTI
jgi:hypothetical protein